MKITIDLETRSVSTELGKTGAWPYAEHPSTDVICLCIKVEGDNIPKVWLPPWVIELLKDPEYIPYKGSISVLRGVQLPIIGNRELDMLIGSAEEIEAHNSEFERAIWYYVLHKRYGIVDLPFYKMRCSAAKAAMHGLPRSLEKACEALGTDVQKDTEGNRLMLRLCKPRTPRKNEWAKLLENPFHSAEAYNLYRVYKDNTSNKLKAMCSYAADNWRACKELIIWAGGTEEIIRCIGYCAGDVLAEESLSRRLEPLPEFELRHWQHDQIINMRGVPIDMEMVNSAIDLIKQYETRLLEEMYALTDGEVKSPRQVSAGKSWLEKKGVDIENMQKATVATALEGSLPVKARRFLEIRQALSKSSTAKYMAAKNMVCSDGRIRGTAMYHGAGTGRFAHKGVQLGNLMKGIFENDEAIDSAVRFIKTRNLDMLIMDKGDPMAVLSSAIRSMICAEEDEIFFCADYSAVEGRGLSWVAGEQWVLDVYNKYDTPVLDKYGNKILDGDGDFMRDGPDMYMVTAGKILSKDPNKVTKEERKSPGKIANLACGYNGGPRAVKAFGGKCPDGQRTEVIHSIMLDRIPDEQLSAKEWFNNYMNPYFSSEDEYRDLVIYGFDFPSDDDIDETWAHGIVTKWRGAHPNIVAFWRGLESAAMNAIRTGYAEYRGIVYFMSDCGRFLKCQLPSKRCLYYPFPELRNRTTPWGQVKLCLSHMNVDSVTRKWVRRFVYGGVLAENVTQAICRDILVEAMYRVETQGYPVILHVHDEILAEVKKGCGSFEEFKSIMTEIPDWAKGFPISASGWVGPRYKKD